MVTEPILLRGGGVCPIMGNGRRTDRPLLARRRRQPRRLRADPPDLADRLDAPQAAFVGFSWGATVGCWLGALHPERTLALALVEGGHFDFADLAGFRTDRTLGEFVAEAEAAAANEEPGFR